MHIPTLLKSPPRAQKNPGGVNLPGSLCLEGFGRFGADTFRNDCLEGLEHRHQAIGAMRKQMRSAAAAGHTESGAAADGGRAS